MYKIVTRLVRRNDWEQEEFIEYWETEHAPLVEELPNVRALKTSVPVDVDEASWDGIAEVYFDTREDLESALESDAGQRVVDDAKQFTDFDAPEKDVLVVRESVQFDGRA